jgi:MFS family permease
MNNVSQERRLPFQFWIMLGGMAVSNLGTSMIWPFLMIFSSQRLGLPLAAVAGLVSINSVCGLISSIIAGPLIDRYGRKWPMTISLFLNALVYIGYLNAAEYMHFALLMAVSGLVSPFQTLGASAMITDMFEGPQRVQGFAYYRMAYNVGLGFGPMLGGLAIRYSYRYGLIIAAISLALQGLLLALFVHETLEPEQRKNAGDILQNLGGMLQSLRDAIFVHFLLAFTLMQICVALIWVLLAVYAKTNFGVSELQYGLIPTTNALMVVFLQVFVTRHTRRGRDMRMISFSGFFYVAAMLVVAFSRSFWGFWAAMVVMTCGELIFSPTATNFVANLAPADKRGRYLGLYGLVWYVATAIGPLGAGFLSDAITPRAPWFAGAVLGCLAILGYVLLDQRIHHEPKTQSESETAPYPLTETN